MSRALLTLANDMVRERAHHWISIAPDNTRVEFKGPQRTLDQNAKMWSMLTDVATQKYHQNRKYTTDQWKAIFMHACGQDVEFLPSLDGSTFIPYGNRSSDLSKAEMSDLIECMTAWGAENNVVWSDPKWAEGKAA